MTEAPTSPRQDALGRTYRYVPDGVHLGLPDEIYFEQEALGSSDLIRLHKRRHGWWWSSRYNPDRIDKTTKEQLYGSALHAIMLEGPPAYEARFLPEPTRPAGAVATIDEMRGALRQGGFRVDGAGAGTSGWKAPDWAAAMRANLPRTPCWPNILADYEKTLRGSGKRRIGEVEDRMLRLMYAAAMGDPHIAGLLADAGGDYPPLAEVSVLHTLPDGTRRRWRLDRLFTRFTMDLKSLGNWHGRPLPYWVGEHIGHNGYEIQRADYDYGRQVLNAYVLNGFEVFGGSIEQRAWLLKLVQQTADAGWDWLWMFYQKPDPAGVAPVIFPVWDDAGSDLFRAGQQRCRAAMKFYADAVARFGLGQPWTHVEEVHYTSEDHQPRLILPHWIGEGIEPDPEADGYQAP